MRSFDQPAVKREGGGSEREEEREYDVSDAFGLSANGAGEFGHLEIPEPRAQFREDRRRQLGDMIFPAFR